MTKEHQIKVLDSFPSFRTTTVLIVIFLMYFLLRLLFFAAILPPNAPPDEQTHVGIIQIYSKVFFLPENSSQTYEYGLVTNTPFLYYWIMGKALSLNILNISDVLFLRLLNIPLAFATIFFIVSTLHLLTTDKITKILLVIMLTNTLMFSVLSASVSYDNLTNLLSAMSIYFFLAFLKYRNVNMLAATFLCQLAGSLTKITFLPLILILNLILIFREFKNIQYLPSFLKNHFCTPNKCSLIMAFVIICLFALNIQLYGGNILKYGKFVPNLDQVISHEDAMGNRMYARNAIYKAFKEGTISFDQALEMTNRYIKNELDRNMNINLMLDYKEHKESKETLLNPWRYMELWFLRMLASTFGAEGGINILNKSIFIPIFIVWILLAGIGAIRSAFTHKTSRIALYLAIIAVFYSLFLMYIVNYRIYLGAEIFNLAVQGRYIFPILGPLYILWSYYLMNLFSRKQERLITCFVTASIFIISDFPFFLMHADSKWFAFLIK